MHSIEGGRAKSPIAIGNRVSQLCDLHLSLPVTVTSLLYYIRQTIAIAAIGNFAAHATNICYNIITTQKSANINHISVCPVAAVRVRYRHLYSFVTQYGC